MNTLEPIEGQLDSMLLSLYAFRMKHHVWGNYIELYRKWLRSTD